MAAATGSSRLRAARRIGRQPPPQLAKKPKRSWAGFAVKRRMEMVLGWVGLGWAALKAGVGGPFILKGPLKQRYIYILKGPLKQRYISLSILIWVWRCHAQMVLVYLIW